MQTDVPRVSLEQAVRVPRAIADNYAGEPTRPLDVAVALNMTPSGGAFRVLCGAAIGYGLTEGGPNAAQISMTELGRRLVTPLAEGDDDSAKREAVLVPTVERQFLQKYDGSPLPAERIALNVLASLGVAQGSASRLYGIIKENAEYVGFFRVIKEKVYVDLDPTEHMSSDGEHETDSTVDVDDGVDSVEEDNRAIVNGPMHADTIESETQNRRVFISHGKNRRVVDQLKEILKLGDFEPVVSVDRESSSKPVPKKVLDDMRSCSAGIIHLSPEKAMSDSAEVEADQGLQILNQNVLIEIGAAMALYNDRFILLVEQHTDLPSNLQGLYEVRYSGDELGFDSIMKVLKALKSVNDLQ